MKSTCLLARGGDREPRNGDVAVAIRDVGDQSVPRTRQKQCVEPRIGRLAGIERVDELGHELVGEAARLQPVVEKEGLVVGYQHADEPPLAHAGQVALPGHFPRRALLEDRFDLVRCHRPRLGSAARQPVPRSLLLPTRSGRT